MLFTRMLIGRLNINNCNFLQTHELRFYSSQPETFFFKILTFVTLVTL